MTEDELLKLIATIKNMEDNQLSDGEILSEVKDTLLDYAARI